jgi:hypothetical protein
MPTGNAIDYKWYRYTDNDGRTFAVKQDKTWGDDADSGLAAFNTDDPVLPVSGARNHPRFVVLVDVLTGRTKKKVVGTLAAFAAIDGTFTQVFKEPGLAGDVTYSYYGKVNEHFSRVGPITSKPEPSTA